MVEGMYTSQPLPTSHKDRAAASYHCSHFPHISHTSAGKPLSKCGKCRRYMKFIAARPSRLYCPVCEDIYNLPQGGSIKLYKV